MIGRHPSRRAGRVCAEPADHGEHHLADGVPPPAQDPGFVSGPPYPLTYTNGQLEGRLGETAASHTQFLRLGAEGADWQTMRVFQLTFELPVINT